MTTLLYRLGHFTARRPWTVLGAWLCAAIIVVSTSVAFGRDLEDTFGAPGVDSQDAIDLLEQAGSEQGGVTAQIVVTPIDPELTFIASPEAQQSLAALQTGAQALPNVLGVSDIATLAATEPDEAIASGQLSPDGRVAIVYAQFPPLAEVSGTDFDAFQTFGSQQQSNNSLQVEMSGELFFHFEESEQGSGELIGLVAAAIILFLAFGSLVATGLPIAIAIFGLVIGVSSLSLVTYVLEIPAFAPQLATMIGLGVGIDYALFLITRHREQLGEGMAMNESIARSVASAGQAVLFAGGTVMIAILGLAVAGIPFMTAGGVATSLVVLIIMIASVTLLPASLALVGHRINPRRKRGSLGVTPASAGPSQRWRRWGDHVTSNAWPYVLGITAFLLLLTAPVLGLQLGNPDEGALPKSRSERRAYDLIAEGFGAGTNGPLIVVVDISEDATVVEPLAAAIRNDPGVKTVAAPEVNQDAGIATLIAFPTTQPQDAETIETIKRLRAEVFPNVLDASPALAHIGGQTASVADLNERISGRMPLFIAAVIAVSFVLLTILFRSIVVAFKAAVLNLLSIGAAYGVLVAVFQWGWGASLIGLETTVPIIAFIPMFMFAMLFGLSMDYEVFLLSRVREQYLVSGDNDEAVIHGITSTAKVISSAALIMIAVFGSFVLSEDPNLKMFGLGLATAIFVDATIVRLILVPASMKLMGDANWWLPDWLDRLLPNVDIDPVDSAAFDATPFDSRPPALSMFDTELDDLMQDGSQVR